MESKKTNKYHRKIHSATKPGEFVTVDVYEVLKAYDVTDSAVAHAIKKLLAPGQRGEKSRKMDLKEAMQSIQRAIEMSTNE